MNKTVNKHNINDQGIKKFFPIGTVVVSYDCYPPIRGILMEYVGCKEGKRCNPRCDHIQMRIAGRKYPFCLGTGVAWEREDAT